MECSSERLSWWTKEKLSAWRADPSLGVPKDLNIVIVKYGVPHALRGAVWPLLAKISEEKMSELKEAYRVLNTRWTPHDQAIQRDIGRTFPAHQYFKESGEAGQEALYRVCKAYSLYDSEVGYCQGQSFLVAALLTVHMPEEEAFALFTTIMHDYGFRSLYLHSFNELRLRFWILESLIESSLPSLSQHFKFLGIEAHMFSSQWFLTLFTAKFPLSLVYHVLDWFLMEGPNVIYRISLAMLRTWRRDLLALDFEGVLRFFRVNLPRQFLNEASVISLIYAAEQEKISEKKEEKLRKEWLKAQDEKESPLKRLERENKRLQDRTIRLDFENDQLGAEIAQKDVIFSKTEQKAYDESKRLGRELDALRLQLQEMRREKDMNKNKVEHLKEENTELKELWRKEVMRRDEEACELRSDILRKNALIADLTLMNERLSVGKDKELITADLEGQRNSLPTSDGALELELAQTKVRLVEIQCRSQDLEHQVLEYQRKLNESQNTWINKLHAKTINSIKKV